MNFDNDLTFWYGLFIYIELVEPCKGMVRVVMV